MGILYTIHTIHYTYVVYCMVNAERLWRCRNADDSYSYTEVVISGGGGA